MLKWGIVKKEKAVPQGQNEPAIRVWLSVQRRRFHGRNPEVPQPILGPFVMMGGVVAGRNAVHVLAIDFEPVKSQSTRIFCTSALWYSTTREFAGQR